MVNLVKSLILCDVLAILITYYMEKYLDSSKITFRNSVDEMKRFFSWYYSKEKDSYMSWVGTHQRCEVGCEVDHPYYWSMMPFSNHYNDAVLRQDNKAIGCFGCSNTFGQQLAVQETWPYLLGTKLGVNCLNFGVSGAGIDSIFLNLKASAKDYSFKHVVINLPSFVRRIARLKHNGNWYRWPVVTGYKKEFGNALPSPIGDDLKIDETKFKLHGEKVMSKIMEDKNSIYSKKVLQRLINFCKSKYDKFYITSWSAEVYEYLEQNYKEHTIPKYNLEGPKTSDGVHPTVLQNKRFIDSIDY